MNPQGLHIIIIIIVVVVVVVVTTTPNIQDYHCLLEGKGGGGA
jgi:hypothetical protein